MENTVSFKNKKFTLDNTTNAKPKYRSQCIDPVHWWAQPATDEEGKKCILFWREKKIDDVFMSDRFDFEGYTDNICDWDNPVNVVYN